MRSNQWLCQASDLALLSQFQCTLCNLYYTNSAPLAAVFSGGAGGARAPPEFGGSQKGRSLISAYQSLAITMNTPGFEKLNTALNG